MKLTTVYYYSRRTVSFNVLPVKSLWQRPEPTALLIIMLALGGGVPFFTTPAWGVFITALLLGAIAPAAWLLWHGHSPALLPAVAALLTAVLLSALLHPGPVAGGNVILWLGAAALLVAGQPLPARPGLLGAAWLFPLVWLLASAAGWQDNPNITASFTAVFVLVLLSSHSKAAIIPIAANLLLLAHLGSRGAMLGLAAGLVVYLWPSLRQRWLLAIPLPLVGLLWLIRPQTAAYRLHYWASTLAAASPWGVGPGGIWLKHLIIEPGSSLPQLHAHNWLLTWLTETGWVLGGLALLPLLFMLPRVIPRFAPWQRACLAALLTHSLVDDPLWWPGPLLLLALIAGTMNKEQ